MLIEKQFTNPYYNRINGLNLGFISHVFLTSKIKKSENKLIYLFYVANIIEHDTLKYHRDKLTKQYLLQKIFDLSPNKKHLTKKELRKLVGLEDRGTFNKYFGEHLKANNLENKRAFTLKEIFIILEFWQGDEKWGRMRAYRKSELAKLFMNNSYDELEFEMTNSILDFEHYQNHDFIKPGDKKIFENILINKSHSEFKILFNQDFNINYLYFFLIVVLMDNLQSFEYKPN